jgi:hypothetical protein
MSREALGSVEFSQIQIQHAVVASVGRDNHIDVEVAEGVAIALHIDCDQVDVPRICALRVHLERRAVGISSANPARVGEAHTHVEQYERALESRSPGPWLKSCRQFELIRDDFAETCPGQRAEQGSDISMPASYHLDAFNHGPGHTLRVQAGSVAHPRKCTRHTAAAS